jgi:hypothetical protein
MRWPVAVVALTLVGCWDDEERTLFDEVEQAADECENACEAWEACVGVEFDVGACEDRCAGAVGRDDVDAIDVDTCADCVEENEGRCVEVCADVCAGANIAFPPL